MSERRNNERFDKEVRVILRWPVPAVAGREPTVAISAGTTADISAGGARIFTSSPPLIGTPVAVTLAWDSPPTAFEHRGRVVWHRKTEDGRQAIGVKFLQGTPECAANWSAFCGKTLAQQPPSPQFSFDDDSADTLRSDVRSGR